MKNGKDNPAIEDANDQENNEEAPTADENIALWEALTCRVKEVNDEINYQIRNFQYQFNQFWFYWRELKQTEESFYKQVFVEPYFTLRDFPRFEQPKIVTSPHGTFFYKRVLEEQNVTSKAMRLRSKQLSVPRWIEK